jgi:spermidine/putrescine transport system substrate-binding protein
MPAQSPGPLAKGMVMSDVALGPRHNRRWLMKAVGLGAVGLAVPRYLRGARASSGELNFLGWSGYDKIPEALSAFEKKSGVKVNFTGVGTQDDMVARGHSSPPGTFDISEPTSTRLPSWIDLVEPWDGAKIDITGLDPAFLQGQAAEMMMVDGKRYGVPSVWGSESLTFNTKDAPLAFGTARLMDLFDDRYAGRLTLRPNSGLFAAGRALEADGKLPHKFAESFVSEDKMAANFDQIIKFAIAKRRNVAQFWSTEDHAQGAFKSGQCVIGHCWDTSAIALQRQGLPIGYIAPKEGMQCWMQNFLLLKGAKNKDQANAWVNWVATPEGGAAWAHAFGANSTTKGAVALADDTQRKFFASAYPPEALRTLWWVPALPSWFVAKQKDYVKAFQSA